MKPQEKIILALDVDDIRQAKCFINALYPAIKIFKVGSQLFTAYGPGIIDFIRKKGAEVFLDLKFFDIPNTVANAVRQAVRLRVKMLTLHISGGEDMLKAAVASAKKEAGRLQIERPLLIGVTVLTSAEVNFAQVLKLAKLGKASGLDGIVCSAKEVARLRSRMGKGFVYVTPGIRPGLKVNDDQKRTATAKEALKAGSDFLVIGRPILEAKDPLLAIKENIRSL